MVRDLYLKSCFAKPVLAAAVIGLLMFLLIALIRYSGLLQSIELAAYDLVLRLRPADSPQQQRIVILAIEEADIRELGTWPLTDATLAELISKITALGPQVIGVDVYRDTPVAPGTEKLMRMLESNDDVIVIEKFGVTASAAVPPPAVLKGTERVGFSDQPVDSDGVVRKGLLFLDDGGEVHYALALRLALKYLQASGIFPAPGIPEAEFLRLGPTTIRPFEAYDGAYVGTDAAGYQYMLDFQGGPQPFPLFSLADLDSGRMTATDIEGRIVMVGIIADSVKDYFLTPYGQGEGLTSGMPGIVLHAHSTSQLLRFALDGEQQLQLLREWQEYFLILLCCLAGIWVGLKIRSLPGLFVAPVLVTAGLMLATYAAFVAGWWVPVVPAILAWLATGALVTAYMSGYEKMQRRLVMDLFSLHVSADVAQEIWKHRDEFTTGGRLETQKVTATVLFSDLEGFTPVSEALDPVALMDWLNQYMDVMAGVVMQYGGFVDDYYGDAIKANFGVPVGHDTDAGIDQDAVNAVRCALAMRREMETLNRRFVQQGLPVVRMRVGICTGPVVAGCLGSAQRMKYTTVGDTVNTAARLESYGKQAHTVREDDGYCRILLAESTAQRLAGQFEVEPVGSVPLKGKMNTINVFRISAESEEEGKL